MNRNFTNKALEMACRHMGRYSILSLTRETWIAYRAEMEKTDAIKYWWDVTHTALWYPAGGSKLVQPLRKIYSSIN